MSDEIRMPNDELPEGWTSVPVQELGHVQLGKMLDRAKNSGTPTAYLRNINVRWFEFDLSDLKTVLVSDDERERFSVLDGDLFICEGGEPGRSAVWKSGKSDVVYQKALHRFRTNGAILPDLLMYRFRLEAESGSLHESFSGSTIKHFTRESLVKYKVPLPPLPEQKRIADKLEAVLGRVDACRARLDRVPALLKRFRQSVLAAATSGKLTEEWREENPTLCDASDLANTIRESHEAAGGHKTGNAAPPSEDVHDLVREMFPEGWHVMTLREVVSPDRPITYGILMPGPELKEGVPYVRVADFPNNRLNLATIRNTSVEMDDKFKRSRLREGDLLLSIRGTVGRMIVVPRELEAANITQDTARLTIQPAMSSTYVLWYLKSMMAQTRMQAATKGVAVRGINIGDVRALQIPLPPLPEQQEIVRRVEDLFTFADRIEARLATAQKTVERLTPATLAKAFRGELVPQDPNDEPASTLLARLGSQPAAKPAKAKRKARK